MMMRRGCDRNDLGLSLPTEQEPKLRKANQRMDDFLRLRFLLVVSHFLVFFFGWSLRGSVWPSLHAGVMVPPQEEGASTKQVEAAAAAVVHPGVYRLLRDFQCGHVNLETPRIIAKGSEGRGRIVVDVGLGVDGQETLDALSNGFVVFGFDMMTGTMDGVRKEAEKRGLLERIHFVEFEADKNGLPVPKDLPRPPASGAGFAYIFHAGLSDTFGAISSNRGGADAVASLKDHTREAGQGSWSPGMVPILPLSQCIPDWVQKIFFVKIDTQGWERKVIRGMDDYLKSHRVQYVQYEFSPWLMRGANSGDPMELIQYMPSLGAICFDMMGEHNKITRPSTNLTAYFNSLDGGMNGNKYAAKQNPRQMYVNDQIGPWDDILCWFPAVTD